MLWQHDATFYYHGNLSQLSKNSKHCFILLFKCSQGNMLLFTSAMKPVLSFNRSCVRKKKSQIMAEIGGENMSKLAIYSMGPFFLFLKNLIFVCFPLEEWKLFLYTSRLQLMQNSIGLPFQLLNIFCHHLYNPAIKVFTSPVFCRIKGLWTNQWKKPEEQIKHKQWHVLG